MHEAVVVIENGFEQEVADFFQERAPANITREDVANQARKTAERIKSYIEKSNRGVEDGWVNAEEVKIEQAILQLRALSKGMQELLQLSRRRIVEEKRKLA